MTFYSYDYFVNQSQVNIYLKYAVIAILLVAVFFLVVKQLRSKVRTQYRDLIFILLLGLLLVGGIQLTDYQTGMNNQNNSSQMLLFLKTAGKNLETDKESLAVNATSLQDEMVVKHGDKYYQIDFNGDLSSYLIKEAYLVNDQVEVKN